MATIKETVDIKCPADKVFAYIADPKTWPKWNLDMLEAKQTSPGPIGIGTTFRGANKIMGRRMPWTAKVTEYKVNKIFRDDITSGKTLIDESLTCNVVEGGTKFSQVFDMQVGGFLKLFGPIVKSSTRKAMKANLTALKSILETS